MRSFVRGPCRGALSSGWRDVAVRLGVVRRVTSVRGRTSSFAWRACGPPSSGRLGCDLSLEGLRPGGGMSLLVWGRVRGRLRLGGWDATFRLGPAGDASVWKPGSPGRHLRLGACEGRARGGVGLQVGARSVRGGTRTSGFGTITAGVVAELGFAVWDLRSLAAPSGTSDPWSQQPSSGPTAGAGPQCPRYGTLHRPRTWGSGMGARHGAGHASSGLAGGR